MFRIIFVNGTTGLNAKYIEEGIYRFVTNTYSSFYKTNGMIGFLVQETDVHKNVRSINVLLKDSFTLANTTHELSKRDILSGFDYCYYSRHISNNNEITIYHLMLDVSKNVQN